MSETSYPPVTLLLGLNVAGSLDGLSPAAQKLADLGQQMLGAADHWALLRDFPMAVQCHQAAAAYFAAAATVSGLDPKPAPINPTTTM